MANICMICGKKLGITQGYPLVNSLPNERICSECNDRKMRLFNTESVAEFVTEKEFFENCLKSHVDNSDYQAGIKLILEKGKETHQHIEAKTKKEQEHQEHYRKHIEKLKGLRDLPVTTSDIQQPYEIIGPIIYNTTNRGIFSSAYKELDEKYKNEPYKLLMKRPAGSSEKKSEFGMLLLSLMDASFTFEGRVGQGSFDNAFYICLSEMKLRCAEMGGNAIVGLKMDFDLDTNNFGGFYIQMYGTAVKLL